MSPFEQELRALAEVRSAHDPIISLYLDTRWNDEQRRAQVRLFVRDNLRALRPAEPYLARSIEEVEAYTEELIRQHENEASNGVAIFACAGLPLFRTFAFDQPFINELRVGETPSLVQLVRQHDDHEPVVVAIVDVYGAHLLQLTLGAVATESVIAGPAHGRHSMGGWSQARYQRHIREQITRNHRQAAEELMHLLDELPGTWLALVGPYRATKDFEEVLPARVRERIFSRLPNPARTGAVHEVIAEVLAALERHEVDGEREAIETLIGDALGGGLALIGPQDVCLAVNEGRVHRLLLDEDFRRTGWRCLRCDALGTKAAAGCAYCGGEVTTVELAAELTRRVLLASGEIDVLAPSPRLRHYHGIGAFLRHRGTVRAGVGYAIDYPVA